jgi:hypothetical protein
MKKQLNSDSDVKYTTVQFHGNNYNSSSNRWIKLNFYIQSLDRLSDLELKFQVNQISKRHLNTGQQRLFIFWIDSLATRETIIAVLFCLFSGFYCFLSHIIHIWIAMLSCFYLVLVSVSQELQVGETRGVSM